MRAIPFRGPVAVASVLCVIGMAGCTSKEQPRTAATRQPPASAQLWSLTTVQPIGQPLAVNGVAVGAVTEDRNLFVVGIDPATGKVLWKQAASPGEVAPGIAVGPDLIGDKIAYFRPDRTGNLYARLVVADPETGKDVAVTPPLLFGSPPQPCADETDVCTLSRRNYNDAYRTHRLRVATGQYVEEKTGLPPGARLIGEGGVVDFGRRDPETLGMVRDGKLRWQIPLSQAFPAGFSTDNGWNWHRFAEQKVYVGSVYGPTSGSPDTVRTGKLEATSASAGLSEETGAVLWRDSGSSIGCGGSLFVDALPDAPDSPIVPVRCRLKGTRTLRPDGPPSFTGLDVTVEGFDVTTGKTTWSVPVQAAEALAGANTLPAIAGQTQVVIRAGSGPLVLDVATGAHQTPAAAAPFWCRLDRHDFSYREPYYLRGVPITTRHGGHLAFVCDASGNQADGPPPGPATAVVGAHIAPYAVVATADGFSGFKVS